MAYIYKITNDINNKVYIGKTNQSVDRRFAQHRKDCQKKRYEKRPLYDAINKYGIDHFYVDVIEECDASDAGDREQYWISQYNSYHNGYNATKGGDGKILYNQDDVKKLFVAGKSLRYIAGVIGCDPVTCHNILVGLGFNPAIFQARANRNGHHKIAKIDKDTGEIVGVFDSMTLAAHSVGVKRNTGLSNAFKKGSDEAYGYKWKIINHAALYS